MAEPASPAPRRRRWRFALSVRGLMLLVLVIGGPIGRKARRASVQRRAVAAVERLGGEVGYDWERAYERGVAPTGPAAPRWARRWLGDEIFQEVTFVRLPSVAVFLGVGPTPERWRERKDAWDRERRREREAGEADQLACLDGLDRLTRLDLGNFGRIGPVAFARIARLGRLESLELAEVEPGMLDRLGLPGLESLTIQANLRQGASPAEARSGRDGVAVDLAFLDRLPGLRDLTLRGFPLGDADTAPIARHDALTSLSIAAPDLTDAGLARLAGLRRLVALSIDHATGLTEAGLAHLARLRSLQVLGLDPAAQLTDAGLAHLAGLAELEHLELGGTKIEGSGIARLRGLTRLEYLRIGGDRIDDRHAADLQPSLPNLIIRLD